MQRIAHTGGVEGTGIAGQYVAYRFGASAVDPTLRDRILTIVARAAIGMTTSSGFETITIQGHAFAFWTRASGGIVMQLTDFQGSGTEQVQLVKTFYLFKDWRWCGGRCCCLSLRLILRVVPQFWLLRLVARYNLQKCRLGGSGPGMWLIGVTRRYGLRFS